LISRRSEITATSPATTACVEDEKSRLNQADGPKGDPVRAQARLVGAAPPSLLQDTTLLTNSAGQIRGQMVDVMDWSRGPQGEQQSLSALPSHVLISLAQQGRWLLMLPAPLLTAG
jgi:hypothetical protein